MKERLEIPGSNVAISRVGFGCARLFGGIEARASRRLIETALALGIRHFDTAPAYGESESILGEVLAGVPSVTIATKFGIPRIENGRTNIARVAYRKLAKPVLGRLPAIKARLLRAVDDLPAAAPDHGLPPHQLTRSIVLQGLEDSLKRLKRDHLDLFLLHEPDQFILNDELAELFDTMRREKLIGAYGLAYGRIAEAAPQFGSILQSCYSPRSAVSSEAGTVRILHGVLRYGWHSRDASRSGRTASNFVASILAKNDNLAIIFSSSSRRQIGDALENIR